MPTECTVEHYRVYHQRPLTVELHWNHVKMGRKHSRGIVSRKAGPWDNPEPNGMTSRDIREATATFTGANEEVEHGYERAEV